MSTRTDVPDLDDSTRALRRLHWPNLLDRHAFQDSAGAALRWLGSTITWREFADAASRFAAALHASGVGRGDRVMLVMMNRPEFLYATIGAHRLGAIVVPVNFRLVAAELTYVIDDSEPAVVVVDESLAGGVRAALDATTTRPRVIVTGGAADSLDSYESFVADHDEHPVVDVDENAAAFIMYTSGTTGRPKGAVLSHLNFHCNGDTCTQAWTSHLDDITLVATPLFHIGGIGVFTGTMLLGTTVVLQPTGLFDADATLDLMADEAVTGTFMVPAQWQALCAAQSAAPRDLRLRVLSWGAAPATEHLLREMAKVFPDAQSVAVFGQTEMSPITCVLQQEDSLRKLGSVGRPIPSLATRVVGPGGRDVAPGEVGEIIYRGPTQMLGYWGKPDATAAAMAGGWFHSGDLVRVDDEGFVYVVDRSKDLIISGGENIYCLEVENVLADHPDIVEVQVIGRADEKWGETPVAVAVLRPGATLRLEELRSWAGERLARYKLPTALETIDELPRNASGKVLKGPLRRQFGAS
ncbi:long-chain-fatty-acid--CoA ligase [Leekyejoonella antrihumi]|uniref:Long-chain-fatty-acid--CoA ligase n=1 Tax=Leekyejoonella antrihumi TaxID=1660198 RepID=A0A563E264_9MICO|nr:long-chain-fatty-acid--CoA ligase [Leekyejoonella antrihumi]TWP36638.1 long-chain-fatty-acid--CoA ligase [Leekyejoonella antrihumi]